MFFDADGNYIDTPFNERRISITVEQLKRTNEVVAVAGGLGKARAIQVIASSGLITTNEVAEDLLKRMEANADRKSVV